jgi:hypothetical protein
VRDYTVGVRRAPDDPWVEVVRVEGNYQRLRVHHIPPAAARHVRLTALATNGAPSVLVYEVRLYCRR